MCGNVDYCCVLRNKLLPLDLGLWYPFLSAVHPSGNSKSSVETEVLPGTAFVQLQVWRSLPLVFRKHRELE